MDANHSEVYVTKLLEQLEELKKKKARRLEKLKKIGRHKKKYFCQAQKMKTVMIVHFKVFRTLLYFIVQKRN
ncbi:hypothetical protein TNCT_80211 [Trichonephila clavata]|uniref:Uncharacterized protein n=1 Tax=Trichonephila clavata TaxID=2740835 RepID=A0A8X6GGK5_TRICU|nr:hypothetical protein TNCT_80211 [Trichonephila clavata]